MRGIRWWVLLVAGPLGLLVAVAAPPLGIFEEPLRQLGVTPEALPMMERTVQCMLGLLWWMLCWWLGEVVPIAVTALLPAAIAPLLGPLRWESSGGAQPIAATELLRAYADPIVLLFLGSFLLAQALQRYELDRRWALWMLSRAGVARTYPRVLLVLMLAVMSVSAWLNNTATAALFMPVAVGIAQQLGQPHGGMAAACVLGVAWAASIGGMTTIVGTAPNGIAVGVLRQHGVEIGFVQWLAFGFPAGMLLLLCGWMVLRQHFRLSGAMEPGVQEYLLRSYHELAPISPAQRRVIAVGTAVVLGWLLQPLLQQLPGLHWLQEWNTVLLGAMLLFVLPAGKGKGALLEWRHAQQIDWGTLLLFGGGLALSGLLVQTQTAAVLTRLLTDALGSVPVMVSVFGLILAANLSTEVLSNTALAALLLPVVAPLLPVLGLPQLPMVVAMAMATSCAFMLPVATPPNAIAYATGILPLLQMVRVGVAMNLLSTVVLGVMVLLVGL